MIFYYFRYICQGTLGIILFILTCTTYTYIVNARRSENDPKKKDYDPVAIFIAPITLPFLIAFAILLFILRAILFGIYLVALTIALVAIRKPFILEWLHKLAISIGEPLLEINTNILRLAFAPWNRSPGSA